MLSDEEIEDCISEACKSLRRHRSAIRGQMCVPADQLDWHVARAVERAAYERAAKECDQAELTGLPSEWDAGYNTACRELGGRIRKLKTKGGS